MNNQLQKTADEVSPKQKRTAVYGGSFQYRWNYDDYEKTLERNRKGTGKRRLKIFTVVITTIFTISFITITGILICDYFTGVNTSRNDAMVDLFGIPTIGKASAVSVKTAEFEPVTTAAETTSEILSTGHAVGITCENITEKASEIYRLPRGVLIKSILSDTNAYTAGLTVGDIIVELSGRQIDDTDDLDLELSNFNAGDLIECLIFRNGSFIELDFKFNTAE